MIEKRVRSVNLLKMVIKLTSKILICLYESAVHEACSTWKHPYYSDVVGTIEIINNTRGNIEGKIWERGDWGANSSPGCSLIHDVPGKKVILDEFFCFLKCFSL